jgi:hypothetical protein
VQIVLYFVKKAGCARRKYSEQLKQTSQAIAFCYNPRRETISQPCRFQQGVSRLPACIVERVPGSISPRLHRHARSRTGALQPDQICLQSVPLPRPLGPLAQRARKTDHRAQEADHQPDGDGRRASQENARFSE